MPYEVTLIFIDNAVRSFVNVLSVGDEDYDLATEILLKYDVRPQMPYI